MTDHRQSKTLELVKDADIYTDQWYFLYRDAYLRIKHKPARKCLDSETKLLIDQVLLEDLSFATVTRALDILEEWLQGCASQHH